MLYFEPIEIKELLEKEDFETEIFEVKDFESLMTFDGPSMDSAIGLQ